MKGMRDDPSKEYEKMKKLQDENADLKKHVA